MDDLAEKEVEVSKVSPFCEDGLLVTASADFSLICPRLLQESRKKAVKLFLQMLGRISGLAL